MKSYITSIGIANPDHCISQDQALAFMTDTMDLSDTDRRQMKAIYNSSGINTRYSVISDYNTSSDNFLFFPKNNDASPNVQNRMALFNDKASLLAIKAIKNCLEGKDAKGITHLITVSCTGMSAPGIDIEIIKALNLKKSVNRVSINFMGCYAAFNALKVGDAICKSDPNAKVLIVCVELCSLHFQNKNSLDHFIANAIFADGAAAVLLESVFNGPALSLDSFYCDLSIEGEKEMAWNITEDGFEMTLSSYVPLIIKSGIKELMDRLFLNAGIDISDISHFAIHPGGRKILEAIENAIGITKEDNKYAYKILRNYGNMSSATVLFVLHEILKDSNIEFNNSNILSFAFGPGLTLESMVLKMVAPHIKNSELEIVEQEMY